MSPVPVCAVCRRTGAEAGGIDSVFAGGEVRDLCLDHMSPDQRRAFARTLDKEDLEASEPNIRGRTALELRGVMDEVVEDVGYLSAESVVELLQRAAFLLER